MLFFIKRQAMTKTAFILPLFVLSYTLKKTHGGEAKMDFNAFSAGIKPGGLNNRTEIKIFVCYLLSSINQPLTREQINDIASGTRLVNYFEINDILTELEKSGNIVLENNAYTITEIGKSVAATLETDLPITVRESAVNFALKLLSKNKIQKENSVEIKKADGGCYVSFIVYDADKIELLRSTLFVTDILQAEKLKENFLKDPFALYESTIKNLTENKT